MTIKPGPCPIGCPPAREVVCVEVLKCYDECYKEEFLEKDSYITGWDTCAVTNAYCAFLAKGTADVDGYRRVYFEQVIEVTFYCADGSIAGVETVTATSFATLYWPDGYDDWPWQPQCMIYHVEYECVEMTENSTPMTKILLLVCKILQIKLPVKLLMPAYGFCEPEPCTAEPFVSGCPAPVYPPQKTDC